MVTEMLQLLDALVPFGPFDLTINRGKKPYLVIKVDPRLQEAYETEMEVEQ